MCKGTSDDGEKLSFFLLVGGSSSSLRMIDFCFRWLQNQGAWKQRHEIVQKLLKVLNMRIEVHLW